MATREADMAAIAAAGITAVADTAVADAATTGKPNG
jgi:hypothetical protein